MLRKFELPTKSFPYRISRRLNLLSTPRKYIVDTGEGMPAFTPFGVRTSALKARPIDRLIDAAWPYVRRLLLVKRQYKSQFGEERVERIDKMIELSNATCYAKLANCVLDLKTPQRDMKRKKAWTESDWKKHMEYIKLISDPRRDFTPPVHKHGKPVPLSVLMPRINTLSVLPPFKIYKRYSQEDWYKDPMKVSPNARKYKISPRLLELSKPRPIPGD